MLQSATTLPSKLAAIACTAVVVNDKDRIIIIGVNTPLAILRQKYLSKFNDRSGLDSAWQTVIINTSPTDK
jgi:hypothetical protein